MNNARRVAGNQINANRAAFDFYPTDPAWVRLLLLEEKFEGDVTEPCAGDGAMVAELEKHGLIVKSSDISPKVGRMIKLDAFDITDHVNVITNPPYGIAYDLINHWLKTTSGKVAVLVRLGFLESKLRFGLFTEMPPSKVIICSSRMRVSGKTSQFAHAWIVWDCSAPHPDTLLRWGLPA